MRRFEVRPDLRFEDDIRKKRVACRRARNTDGRRFQRYAAMAAVPIEDECERLALRLARGVSRSMSGELGLGHARERSIGQADRRAMIMDVDNGSRRTRYRSVPYESGSGVGMAAPRR